jgi:hypothetical protein
MSENKDGHKSLVHFRSFFIHSTTTGAASVAASGRLVLSRNSELKPKGDAAVALLFQTHWLLPRVHIKNWFLKRSTK